MTPRGTLQSYQEKQSFVKDNIIRLIDTKIENQMKIPLELQKK